MTMDIDEIRAFVSIVQLGGFTRAADRLHRSQPAVSRRIGLLEQELATPLLERVRGGVTLTEAGRAFLPFAEAILAAVEDGRQAVRATLSDRAGAVSLALVGTLADSRIVEVLRKFAQRAKAVDLDLRTATSHEVSELVRRGEVTLGLRYFDDDRADLSARRVGEERLVVICSPEHAGAGRRLKPAQLRDERWVAFPATGGRESLGKILERHLITVGLDEARITVIDSLTAQKLMVEAGFGIALVPASSVRDELKLGTLKALDVAGLRASVPVVLVHRRKGYLSPAARALIALISDAAPHLARRSGAGR